MATDPHSNKGYLAYLLTRPGLHVPKLIKLGNMKIIVELLNVQETYKTATGVIYIEEIPWYFLSNVCSNR
jgi:hypothetical protein